MRGWTEFAAGEIVGRNDWPVSVRADLGAPWLEGTRDGQSRQVGGARTRCTAGVRSWGRSVDCGIDRHGDGDSRIRRDLRTDATGFRLSLGGRAQASSPPAVAGGLGHLGLVALL